MPGHLTVVSGLTVAERHAWFVDVGAEGHVHLCERDVDETMGFPAVRAEREDGPPGPGDEPDPDLTLRQLLAAQLRVLLGGGWAVFLCVADRTGMGLWEAVGVECGVEVAPVALDEDDEDDEDEDEAEGKVWPGILSRTEVARVLGVQTSAVDQWRVRAARRQAARGGVDPSDFPQALPHFDGTVWSATAVLEWAKLTGRTCDRRKLRRIVRAQGRAIRDS